MPTRPPLALLSLAALVLLGTPGLHAAPPDAYQPAMAAGEALEAADAAFRESRFNPDRFAVRKLEYFETLDILARAKDANKEGQQGGETALATIAEKLGTGPLWQVTYWRTEALPPTVERPGINHGLVVLVFKSGKAAVIDLRAAATPADEIPNPEE